MVITEILTLIKEIFKKRSRLFYIVTWQTVSYLYGHIYSPELHAAESESVAYNRYYICIEISYWSMTIQRIWFSFAKKIMRTSDMLLIKFWRLKFLF